MSFIRVVVENKLRGPVHLWQREPLQFWPEQGLDALTNAICNECHLDPHQVPLSVCQLAISYLKRPVCVLNRGEFDMANSPCSTWPLHCIWAEECADAEFEVGPSSVPLQYRPAYAMYNFVSDTAYSHPLLLLPCIHVRKSLWMENTSFYAQVHESDVSGTQWANLTCNLGWLYDQVHQAINVQKEEIDTINTTTGGQDTSVQDTSVPDTSSPDLTKPGITRAIPTTIPTTVPTIPTPRKWTTINLNFTSFDQHLNSLWNRPCVLRDAVFQLRYAHSPHRELVLFLHRYRSLS